jgi:molecular chaperone DnaK
MKRIIGIDLGTTNSAAAFIDNGEARIIPNDRGHRITPSMVAFSADDEILIGEAAKNQAVINAGRTISSAKRFMGTEHTYTVGKRKLTPEYISSLILSKVKTDSENYLGEKVRDAVITVPAHFSESQRRATITAGEMAGLKVARIINEPTAAALAYAYELKKNNKILVYDLGGGTFDVTFLEKIAHRFIVKSTRGNRRLGGIDFDTFLLGKIIEVFSQKVNIDIEKDPIILQQLRDQVERAKVELSSSTSAMVALPFIHGSEGPVHLSYTVERDELEAIIGPEIEKTIELSLQAVKEAGYSAGDVESLILAGGSSRIPLVREKLGKVFRQEPVRKINPEEVVALGAAVQGAMLDSAEHELVLQDIVSHPLGLEIDGGRVVHLVQKNTPIPVTDVRVFTTISDNQSSVEIHVVQGDKSYARENKSLGRFLLSDIRRGKKGEPRIEVDFTINEDGILLVKARDLDTGSEQKVTLNTGDSIREEGEGELPGLGDLNKRVKGLIRKTEDYVGRLKKSIDSQFRKEIDELLKTAKSSADSTDSTVLTNLVLSLETVVGELNAIGQIEEEMTV